MTHMVVDEGVAVVQCRRSCLGGHVAVVVVVVVVMGRPENIVEYETRLGSTLKPPKVL